MLPRLLAALLAVPLVLPILFGLLFCGVYLLLVLANALRALYQGYRRRPAVPLLSRRAMTIASLLLAGLGCALLLCNIDGRFT